jgi:hypothetical protein
MTDAKTDPTDANSEKEYRPPKRSRWSRVRALAAPLVAIGLLVFVFRKYDGLSVIQSAYERIGWNWPLLLVPWIIWALLAILAYRGALPDRGKAIPFWILVQIERSGSALNAFLPFGNNSGQIIKVTMLRHWYSSEALVGTAAWTGLASGNVSAFGALGPLVCLALGFGDPIAVGILAAVAVVTSIPSLTVLYLLPRGLPQRVARLLTRLPANFVATRKERWTSWAKRLDTHLVAAVTHRKRDYMRLIGMRLLQQCVRIGEIWLVIELLELPGGILTALLMNALSRAVTQLGAFVPGRLGLLEFVTATTFAALGFTEADGLAVALTLRVRYVANLCVSFTALAGLNRLAEKYPARSESEREAAREAQAQS